MGSGFFPLHRRGKYLNSLQVMQLPQWVGVCGQGRTGKSSSTWFCRSPAPFKEIGGCRDFLPMGCPEGRHQMTGKAGFHWPGCLGRELGCLCVFGLVPPAFLTSSASGVPLSPWTYSRKPPRLRPFLPAPDLCHLHRPSRAGPGTLFFRHPMRSPFSPTRLPWELPSSSWHVGF